MVRATLGVSLGGRTTGLAIVKDQELLIARSLTLRNKQTLAHTIILDAYIKQYKIETVVIKTPPKTHLSERLKLLFEQLIELFAFHGCIVKYSDSNLLKKPNSELKTKTDVIWYVAQSYPRLIPVLEKELRNKQKYHVKMFEAVTIAHITHTKNLSP